MKWVYALAHAYATNNSFKEAPGSGTTFPLIIPAQMQFPTTSYQHTTWAMHFFWSNYTYAGHGFGAVNVSTPLLGGGPAQNWPVVPGIQVNPKQFYDPEPVIAISTLVHEGQHHPLSGSGFLGFGAHGGTWFYPTEHLSPTGFLESDISTLMTWIEYQKLANGSGMSLLDWIESQCASKKEPTFPSSHKKTEDILLKPDHVKKLQKSGCRIEGIQIINGHPYYE